MIDKQIQSRMVLAEAIAALWVSRSMPAFSDIWIPIGIAGMLGDRFLEFNLGINESSARWLVRKQRYHSLVERGFEWQPLVAIADVYDPIVRLKSPLVMECLRRSIVGDSDMRTAFHDLALISSGKKGPFSTDAFFFHLTCTVGQHTEAGNFLPKFSEEWIRSVGVPVIHIGFSMLDKKRFQINVVQRPLQRINCHDNTALCSPAVIGGTGAGGSTGIRHGGCACSGDYVCRKDEPNGGATYMRPHLNWPVSGRRRFWPGDIEISIFRSANYRVTTTVTMTASGSDSDCSVLTVPFVSPRKHEMILNRQARDDELVHGWLTFSDDRWLLAKIVICQSPLMWCNKLQMSRHVLQEQMAVEALQHIRGSALVQEVLVDALTKSTYCYKTRQEAARSLIHLALGCQEREAMISVINWLDQFSKPDYDWSQIDPKQFLTFFGACEHIALSKRTADRRDARAISDLMIATVRSIERSLTLKPPSTFPWRINPDFMLSCAIRNAIVSCTDPRDKAGLSKAVDGRLKSDLYGPPLASAELIVMESVLSAAQANSGVVSSIWPFIQQLEFIESLTVAGNRKLTRSAIRAYISMIGSTENSHDTESAWLMRFRWIDTLTDQIVTRDTPVASNLQTLGWLVDCWEFILEKYRRDNLKSPLAMLMQKKDTCDRLWRYLTIKCPLLPPCVRWYIQKTVHNLYLQAYGTSVPVPHREGVDRPREIGQGPMSFWLPFREHERLYRRFIMRGTTVKLEAPIGSKSSRKPRILITGAGAVPLVKPQ